MPISVATPTMMKELMPQSRSAMSRGVLSNADIVILSKTTSLGSGLSSGTSSNPGDPRRNQGFTSPTDFTRCQAIAMRNWKTPEASLGTAQEGSMNTRGPPSGAASRQRLARWMISGPRLGWRVLLLGLSCESSTVRTLFRLYLAVGRVYQPEGGPFSAPD